MNLKKTTATTKAPYQSGRPAIIIVSIDPLHIFKTMLKLSQNGCEQSNSQVKEAAAAKKTEDEKTKK